MIITKELVYQLKVLCDTASTDTTRPILTTVHVEVEPKRAFLVAADGYRLSAVCLPIETETEDSFTLQIDAKVFKKWLAPKIDVSITPTGLDIQYPDLDRKDGSTMVGAKMVLSNLDVGQCYPDWRAILPHSTEPRANIAAFMAKYSIEFLKFRLGRGYNKTTEYSGYSIGLPTFSLMHYSIYDGDKCGMASPSAWAWAESYNSDTVVYYLHVLMPISAMELAPTAYIDNDVTEERIEAYNKGNKQLVELLEERFTSKITYITGPLVGEVWGRKEDNIEYE